MSRFIAFLRAINVGGHTVRMEELRRLFESLGYSNVETFIASGNVVFETAAKKPATLERRISARLGEALGFEVATFIRSDAELSRMANYRPFPQAALDGAAALNIALLATTIEPATLEKLMGLRTAIDDFASHGREVYWLCRRNQSKSTFSNAVLERVLGRPATLRGANTIRRMAERYGV